MEAERLAQANEAEIDEQVRKAMSPRRRLERGVDNIYPYEARMLLEEEVDKKFNKLYGDTPPVQDLNRMNWEGLPHVKPTLDPTGQSYP